MIGLLFLQDLRVEVVEGERRVIAVRERRVALLARTGEQAREPTRARARASAAFEEVSPISTP